MPSNNTIKVTVANNYLMIMCSSYLVLSSFFVFIETLKSNREKKENLLVSESFYVPFSNICPKDQQIGSAPQVMKQTDPLTLYV
jgi:hypothetical protein